MRNALITKKTSMMPAKLGEDLGRYGFRTFSLPVKGKGKVTVMARATNAIGQTQTTKLIHNPPGYHHNVVQSVTLTVAEGETSFAQLLLLHS